MNKILFFTSNWCPTCQDIKQKLGTKEQVEYVDVEEQVDLANKYSVRSLPTAIKLNEAGEILQETSKPNFIEVLRMLDKA